MPLLLGPFRFLPHLEGHFSFDEMKKPHSSEDKQGVFRRHPTARYNEDTKKRRYAIRRCRNQNATRRETDTAAENISAIERPSKPSVSDFVAAET
jgi:hypothetical protein